MKVRKSILNIFDVPMDKILTDKFMQNFFGQCLSVNRDQINLARRCILQKVNNEEVDATKNIEMRDLGDKLILFFHVGIPTKSKTKKVSDCKKIPFIGDWTPPRSGRRKRKRKIAGGIFKTGSKEADQI